MGKVELMMNEDEGNVGYVGEEGMEFFHKIRTEDVLSDIFSYFLKDIGSRETDSEVINDRAIKKCLAFRVLIPVIFSIWPISIEKKQDDINPNNWSLKFDPEFQKKVHKACCDCYCSPGNQLTSLYVIGFFKNVLSNTFETKNDIIISHYFNYVNSSMKCNSYDQVISPHLSYLWDWCSLKESYSSNMCFQLMGFPPYGVKESQINLLGEELFADDLIVGTKYIFGNHMNHFIRLKVLSVCNKMMESESLYSIFLCSDLNPKKKKYVIVVAFKLSPVEKIKIFLGEGVSNLVVFCPLYWLGPDGIPFLLIEHPHLLLDITSPTLSLPNCVKIEDSSTSELEVIELYAKRYFSKKDYFSALQLYKFLCGFKPEHSKYLRNTVVCLNKSRFYSEARKEVDHLLDLEEPNQTLKTMYQKVISSIGERRYKEAVKMIKGMRKFSDFKICYEKRLSQRLINCLRCWKGCNYQFEKLFSIRCVPCDLELLEEIVPEDFLACLGGKNPGFEIRKNNEGVFAIRDISEGEILIVEKAYLSQIQPFKKNNETDTIPMNKIFRLKRRHCEFEKKLYDLSKSCSSISEYFFEGSGVKYDGISLRDLILSEMISSGSSISRGMDACQIPVVEALYRNASKFSRTCMDHNCSNEVFGDVIVIVAKRNILEGEELTITARYSPSSFQQYHLDHINNKSFKESKRFVCVAKRKNVPCGICENIFDNQVLKVIRTVFDDGLFERLISGSEKNGLFLSFSESLSEFEKRIHFLGKLPIEKKREILELLKDDKSRAPIHPNLSFVPVYGHLLQGSLMTLKKIVTSHEDNTRQNRKEIVDFSLDALVQFLYVLDMYRLSPRNITGLFRLCPMIGDFVDLGSIDFVRLLWKLWRRFFGKKNLSAFLRTLFSPTECEEKGNNRAFLEKVILLPDEVEGLKVRKSRICTTCNLSEKDSSLLLGEFKKFKKCAKCKKVRYCSRECQLIDWILGHRIVCN